MTRLPLSDRGGSRAERVLGHRPEVLDAWRRLERSLAGPGSLLAPEVKEQARRTLAQRTGCAFCASLGEPAAAHADPRASLAAAFAGAVADDHRAIVDRQVDALAAELGVDGAVELIAFVCFEYAGQMLGSLIGDEPASEPERRAFARARGLA